MVTETFERREERGPYRESYSPYEPVPFVGKLFLEGENDLSTTKYDFSDKEDVKIMLNDPLVFIHNQDGWHKVAEGLVDLYKENGEWRVKVTDEGVKVLGKPDSSSEAALIAGSHHAATREAPEKSATAYRTEIRMQVKDVYGPEYEAHFTDETENEKRKSHNYTLRVVPVAKTKENRFEVKATFEGTLKKINRELTEEMMRPVKKKIRGGK